MVFRVPYHSELVFLRETGSFFPRMGRQSENTNLNPWSRFSKIKEQVFGTKPTELRISVIGMTVLPSTEKEEIGHLRVKDSLWPRVEMTQESKCGSWDLSGRVPKLGGPFSYYGFMWGQIFFQYFNQNIVQQVWESSCLLWRQTFKKILRM